MPDPAIRAKRDKARAHVMAEPVLLTWRLFLWAYCVPMLLVVCAVVGGYFALRDQAGQTNRTADKTNLTAKVLAAEVRELDALRRDRTELSRKTDFRLCVQANESNDILADLITRIINQQPTEAKKDAARDFFGNALERLAPVNCKSLPTQKPTKPATPGGK